MIFAPRIAYALGAYHLVCVHFIYVPENVPPVVTAMSGLKNGEEIERSWETVWHSDTFARDDIDSADVQRGYQRHEVGPVVRRMYSVDEAQLLNWKGRVRIQQPGSNPDPYLVGFASTYLEAARWVATGAGRHFLPWPVQS